MEPDSANPLEGLTPNQLRWINKIAIAFHQSFQYSRNPISALVNDVFVTHFGDFLRVSHCLSSQPVSKDKFEYAMEEVYRSIGYQADRSTNCLPGQDITVNGENWSLKTQADRSIREDKIHISKFMELGKGAWSTEDDFRVLLGLYLKHLERYERIFTLRYIRTRKSRARRRKIEAETSSALNAPVFKHRYELVEIPKSLFLLAADRPVRIMVKTRQINHPPAYVDVEDGTGDLMYCLYFDGGSERKLQVKKLRKDLCIVHATWRFD